MNNAELIKALRQRSEAKESELTFAWLYETQGAMSQAADLIEAQAKTLEDCAAQFVKLTTRIAELESQIPKEGEWIHGRELGKEWLYDHWVAYFEDWRCSNCGIVFEQESKPKYHYCPNCGARMKGQETDDGTHVRE